MKDATDRQRGHDECRLPDQRANRIAQTTGSARQVANRAAPHSCRSSCVTVQNGKWSITRTDGTIFGGCTILIVFRLVTESGIVCTKAGCLSTRLPGTGRPCWYGREVTCTSPSMFRSKTFGCRRITSLYWRGVRGRPPTGCLFRHHHAVSLAYPPYEGCNFSSAANARTEFERPAETMMLNDGRLFPPVLRQ
jgi:hypothetical protein